MENTTIIVNIPTSRHINVICQIVVTISYVIGIIGNSAALYSLRHSFYKHKRIILMLRCLVTNDLVALLGMLILMNTQIIYPFFSQNKVFCGLRVMWKVFGLGSGCIAIVMAIERWFALVKPFAYKKYITYTTIKQAIFGLWAAGALVTCLPFFGFGLFFEDFKCRRYREAEDKVDVAYAFVFFAFGTLLCSCIVWCNLGVVRELMKLGKNKKLLVRRFSRNSTRFNIETSVLNNNTPTSEEIAFAKLMIVLCISFVVCWMPQMISILIYQFGSRSRTSQLFFRLSDVLIALHFTLDPFLYVLLRFKKKTTENNEILVPLNNITTDTSVSTTKPLITKAVN